MFSYGKYNPFSSDEEYYGEYLASKEKPIECGDVKKGLQKEIGSHNVSEMEQDCYSLRSKRFQFEAWWVMEESFEEEVKRIARSFFQNLFSTKGIGVTDHILTGVENCISNEANLMLMEKFTEGEVITTLKGMGPTKVSGEDGCLALFFQKCWHIMGKYITSHCLEVLNEGVLEDYISSAQSALVPGRLISNNVLLAYEICILSDKREWRKKDLWTWVEFIIQCVTSVSYSMIVNGKAREVCKPSIGLWQGDPLSPFLFLICSEGLSALMKLALNEGLVKGDKVSRRGLQIMHILFADDCVLFGEANENGAHTLKRFLKEYEMMPGYQELSGNINNNEITRVSNLIDNSTRTWKIEVIKYTFSEDDAGRILQIPLATVEHEDMLVRRGEPFESGSPRCLGEVRLTNVIYSVVHFGSAMGLVARNDRGEVLVSKSTLNKEVAFLFAAEARAYSKAVRLGISMGVEMVEIKGNALTIIKKCHSNAIDKSKIGAYIRDI
ncbi:hypothetical protein PVK06_035971 [Gossypium arboreum]|uniref:Reverse transcriptase n=1 Tax=Gossypium arboreum TaxID=29729 RepID=A0ABR0NI96_GOSAR|nr:hypothetical protein PVK06_035971 [Gossypium arboreum]